MVDLFYFNHCTFKSFLLNAVQLDFQTFTSKFANWENLLASRNNQLTIWVSACYSQNILKNLDMTKYPHIHLLLTSDIDRTISRNAYIVDDTLTSFTEFSSPSVRKLGLSLNDSTITNFSTLISSNSLFNAQFRYTYVGRSESSSELFNLVFGPNPGHDLACIGSFNQKSVFIDEHPSNKRVTKDDFVQFCKLNSEFKIISVSKLPEELLKELKNEERQELDLTLEDVLVLFNREAFDFGIPEWKCNLSEKNPSPHPDYQSDPNMQHQIELFMKSIGAPDDFFFLFSFLAIFASKSPDKSIFEHFRPLFLGHLVKIEKIVDRKLRETQDCNLQPED